MTLDLSEVKKIAVQCGADFDPVEIIFHLPKLEAFAQAIYAMGAAEQKEKDIKICESEWNGDSDTLIYSEACNDCAEAIRSQE